MRAAVSTMVASLFLLAADPNAALAQTAADMDKTLAELYGVSAPYHEFFEKLQKAVQADDRQAVASMVEYPFAAHVNGKAVKIRDAKHFVDDYTKIITPKVKEAILGQRYADLFANWQGVMIGDGEVWFSGIDDKNTVRIIAINN
jgi:hypothetical protein